MKRLLFTILLFTAALPAAAQLYHPGEQLFYRVSYKAKMFPNTEVGAVEVKTSEVQLDDRKFYKVEGIGRTLPTYRWFFNLEDIYTVWISPETLRPVRFESDIKEGDYTFQSYYTYDWDNSQVHTRWRRRQRPFEEKTMPLTPGSMDAIALFFTMRSANAEDFKPGEPATLQMVLHGTLPDAEIRMSAGNHRGIFVHRRHDLHDLDLRRREQNPALHRVARPRRQHQCLYFGLQGA